MASPRTSVKRRLTEFLAGRRFRHLGEDEWEEICRAFPGSTPGYLRRLLRGSGLSLAPLVEGVRQENLEEFERTLLALEREYSDAVGKGDSCRQDVCRRRVIEAKDHARLAMRRGSDHKRALKKEMIAWMLVWLDHPAAFPAWLRLRKRSLRQSSGAADETR